MPFARNQSATKLVVSAVTVVLLSIAPYAVSLAGATAKHTKLHRFVDRPNCGPR